MSETRADLLIDRIADWGVKALYGYPGDGINGILAAMRRRQDRVRFIQTRHEEQTAVMACARSVQSWLTTHRAPVVGALASVGVAGFAFLSVLQSNVQRR